MRSSRRSNGLSPLLELDRHVSLASPGDTVIICSYGYFCERQIIMAERLGFNVVPLRTEWGKSMDPQVLAEALKEHPETQLVLGIHAETSTGTIQPIAEFARLSHEAGALFMTDVVTSLAGCELKFDEWELDFAYSGSQKCLAAPPGISPVAISDRALEYIRNRPKPPTSWYLDLSLIADYWGPDHIAHHTAPVSMIYGLREAVGMALNETLEVRWQRHEANASALRAGLTALGLELPISKEERLDQLTVVKLPKGIDDVNLRTQLLEEYQKAPEVTRDRMYIDAMQKVLSSTTKIMIDIDSGNNLMLLPLDKMMDQGNKIDLNQFRLRQGDQDE